MTEHDVILRPVARTYASRRDDWYAACTGCAWTGEPHENPSTAAFDGAEHLKLNAPKGKDS